MDYLKKVVKKIKSELPGSKVFLFGSRANNTAKDISDYDIGIIWDDKKVPLNVMSKINSYVEELPVRIDIVDFNAVDEDFKEYVFKTNINYL